MHNKLNDTDIKELTDVILLSDKILVEVESNEKKTSSGLIVAQSNDPSEIKTGKVVAVGLGRLSDYQGERKTMMVKVGHDIMFQYGTKVIVEGLPYMLITESADVIMILLPPARN